MPKQNDNPKDATKKKNKIPLTGKMKIAKFIEPTKHHHNDKQNAPHVKGIPGTGKFNLKTLESQVTLNRRHSPEPSPPLMSNPLESIIHPPSPQSTLIARKPSGEFIPPPGSPIERLPRNQVPNPLVLTSLKDLDLNLLSLFACQELECFNQFQSLPRNLDLQQQQYQHQHQHQMQCPTPSTLSHVHNVPPVSNLTTINNMNNMNNINSMNSINSMNNINTLNALNQTQVSNNLNESIKSTKQLAYDRSQSLDQFYGVDPQQYLATLHQSQQKLQQAPQTHQLHQNANVNMMRNELFLTRSLQN